MADERVPVQEPLQICPGVGAKSQKSVTNLSRFFLKKAGNNLPILSVGLVFFNYSYSFIKQYLLKFSSLNDWSSKTAFASGVYQLGF